MIKKQQQEENALPRIISSRVKAVLSGNRFVLQGPKDQYGVPIEKTLNLIGVKAPEVGFRENIKGEENMGFEIREYLRKMLIGKMVDFKIEFKTLTKILYGTIVYKGEEIANTLLKLGYAKVDLSQDKVKKAPINIEEYKSLEEIAKSQKIGIWNTEKESKIRKLELVQFDEKYCSSKNEKKIYQGIIEGFNAGLFLFLSLFIF